MAVTEQSMTTEQRKSVALEYTTAGSVEWRAGLTARMTPGPIPRATPGWPMASPAARSAHRH